MEKRLEARIRDLEKKIDAARIGSIPLDIPRGGGDAVRRVHARDAASPACGL